MLLKTSKNRKGQAIIELLPSVLLFLIVVGGGLSYFQMMREVTIRQEVVRNLAFAKINNVGTLTTPLSQGANEVLIEGFPAGGRVIGPSRFDFVSRTDGCFTVTPSLVRKPIQAGSVFGIGALTPINVTTYAVIYRRPDVNCPP
jgi:hypothetical protein